MFSGNLRGLELTLLAVMTSKRQTSLGEDTFAADRTRRSSRHPPRPIHCAYTNARSTPNSAFPPG